MVIAAALELIDTRGLGALSMRELSARLGVTHMVPYRFFENKDALLDAITGEAFGRLSPEAEPDARWDEQIAGAIRSMHEVLLEHPGIVEIITAREREDIRDAHLDDLRERLVSIVSAAGLDQEVSGQVLRILTSYVVGWVIVARVRPAGPGEEPEMFEFGLELLISSLRRLAESS